MNAKHNMSRISRNLSIVFRSERLIAQRQLAVLRQQTGMMIAAGVTGGIGLLMINAAAYLALAETLSPATAALIVAVANFILAALLVWTANRVNADAEVAGVTEVRDMAMEDLEAEVTDAVEEVKTVAQGIRKMTQDPLGSLAPGLVGTLASALLKNLK